MQPKFSGLSVGPEVTRRLQEEIQRSWMVKADPSQAKIAPL